MKIYIASDHAGFALKGILHKYLVDKQYDVEDLGPSNEDPVNWAEYGAKVAKKVSHNPEGSKGILICGTGLGMSIVANKFKGVRAAVGNDPFLVEMSRKHNNANILTMGARVIDHQKALGLLELWLNTHFEAGRHQKRLDFLIHQVEVENFKN